MHEQCVQLFTTYCISTLYYLGRMNVIVCDNPSPSAAQKNTNLAEAPKNPGLVEAPRDAGLAEAPTNTDLAEDPKRASDPHYEIPENRGLAKRARMTRPSATHLRIELTSLREKELRYSREEASLP